MTSMGSRRCRPGEATPDRFLTFWDPTLASNFFEPFVGLDPGRYRIERRFHGAEPNAEAPPDPVVSPVFEIGPS